MFAPSICKEWVSYLTENKLCEGLVRCLNRKTCCVNGSALSDSKYMFCAHRVQRLLKKSALRRKSDLLYSERMLCDGAILDPTGMLREERER